jgi:hypothetical protein
MVRDGPEPKVQVLAELGGYIQVVECAVHTPDPRVGVFLSYSNGRCRALNIGWP